MGLLVKDDSLYSPAAEHSKQDVAKIIGRSTRNISYWTDFGLVIPDIKPSQGKGIKRLYSDRNLIEFAMIDVMVKEVNVSLDIAQLIFNDLRAGYSPKDKVEFQDFYESDEWGISKELAVVIWFLLEELEPVLKYHIIKDRAMKIVDFDPVNSFGPLHCTAIGLGRIKNWAIYKHKLPFLPHGFDPSKKVLKTRK